MENIKSLEETIIKVEVPKLNNSEYGKDIADKFDNINKNFQTLANHSFIKGDKGENTTIEKVDISNYIDSIGHVIYGDNKPDGWDELLPQNIYLYKNGADYIGGIPFVYMDPKFKDGQIPENESDNSCIIVPNSEEGIFRFEKLDLFPTLYWNGTNFCWKVNGQKTGLIARGPKGEDGEDGNLYIIQADINADNKGICVVKYINLGSKDGNADGWVDVSKLDNKLLSEFDKKNAVVFAYLSSDISDEDERLNTFWIGKMELIDNKLQIICTENNKVKLAYNDRMLFDSFLRFGKTSSPFKGIFIPFEYNEGGTKYNAGYTFISDPGNKCLSIKTSKNIESNDWNKEVYDDKTADGHDRSYNNLKIFPRTHFEMPARFNSMADDWAIYVNNHGIYNGGNLWNDGELINHGDVNVYKGIYASKIHSNGSISADLGASFSCDGTTHALEVDGGASFSCDGTTHALEVDGGSLFHDKPVFKKGIFIGDNEYNSTISSKKQTTDNQDQVVLDVYGSVSKGQTYICGSRNIYTKDSISESSNDTINIKNIEWIAGSPEIFGHDNYEVIESENDIINITFKDSSHVINNLIIGLPKISHTDGKSSSILVDISFSINNNEGESDRSLKSTLIVRDNIVQKNYRYKHSNSEQDIFSGNNEEITCDVYAIQFELPLLGLGGKELTISFEDIIFPVNGEEDITVVATIKNENEFSDIPVECVTFSGKCKLDNQGDKYINYNGYDGYNVTEKDYTLRRYQDDADADKYHWSIGRTIIVSTGDEKWNVYNSILDKFLTGETSDLYFFIKNGVVKDSLASGEYATRYFIKKDDMFTQESIKDISSFITRIYGDLEVKGNIKYEGDISQGEISGLSMKPQQLSICDYEGGISELIQNLEYLIDKRVEEGKIDYINCTYSESFTNGFISININDGVINVSGMLSSPYYLGPIAIGLEGTYEVNENTIHITTTNSDNAIKNLITNEYIKL